ncbi:MAG: tyrosine-type recombinase/integrase [Proteobacteria bacterium]|nr:tyrosine-type recombinase/integrase [Pseudomonadota bacterium]
MLEKVYVMPATVDRIRKSWIIELIEKYLVWLKEQKYSDRTIFRRIPIVVQFGEYSAQRGAKQFNQLPDHVELFVQRWSVERLTHLPGEQRKKEQDCVRNPVRQMLQIALPDYEGLGRSRKQENPFAKQAPLFFDYLRREKGLKEASIRHYQHYLRGFSGYLERLGAGNLKHLSAVLLSGFIAEYSRKVKWAGLRNACGVLKVFTRYLYREGVTKKDLSQAVEGPQKFRMSDVPKSISWDQVQSLLKAVDRRSSTGKRDSAILLLLITYGLRASDIAKLTLDDFDWKNEKFRVRERKAGHSTGYPLSKIVGEAIIDYLKHGRPDTKDRSLFFRSFAPLKPIGSAAIVSRAGHYLRKAKIKVPRYGSHVLRHTCVQRLIDADFPLKSIGDYVGHRSPSSTQM